MKSPFFESFTYRLKKRRAKRTKRNLGFLLAPTPTFPLDVDFSAADLSADRFRIISYATRDGFYDWQLDRLKQSCIDQGLSCATETIPNCSALNAQLFKPTFIKFKLLTLQATVVWVDADAIVTAPFSLPAEAWDLATVSNQKNPDKNPILSLCIAFRPTIGALRFLEAWEHLCSAQWLGHVGDHERLTSVRRLHISPAKAFTEIDISDRISGCIRRDIGKNKEGLL
ncbi:MULTISPECIES: hypothetical protein [unclassified Halorhodospira]|uniref:hypothetical protein n=1 Tax=unclassified Halorhodospira TaxID=2626748 RepID=UPI001EE816EC|nr:MULTISPECIES: hypothetical protein [unclassified Halorhodospira]MCG5541616.1 hypothetical protein [Halorhodospira sp. M39old]MCG5546551.1 hypothetical protein [Halorhodospira sp. M38]